MFFFQAEDGIRDLVRSRGLGDVYKRQPLLSDIIYSEEKYRVAIESILQPYLNNFVVDTENEALNAVAVSYTHLTLPTSDLV